MHSENISVQHENGVAVVLLKGSTTSTRPLR